MLIDYPGVNIPLGKFLKTTFGCQVSYYIPPNEWLFSRLRTPDIVGFSDQILSVYPAEAEYYRGAGGNVTLVGHPLVEFVERCPSRTEARAELGVPQDCCLVALLPASRKQEVRRVWPVILEAAAELRRLLLARDSCSRPIGAGGLLFVIPAATEAIAGALKKGLLSRGLADCCLIWQGKSHVAMAASDLAITKSGSVNVELALLGVPQVVVYRVDAFSAWILRAVLRVQLPYIALVNVILNRKVVPEFVQEAAVPHSIAHSAAYLLKPGSEERESMLAGYNALRQHLGQTGASKQAARRVLDGLA